MDPNILEEIAYRNRPPLLEDASIRGPTRTPVRDAMLTLEERDAIEADFRWYRYSKFALPWLLYILALGATVFCLSVWQQVGDYTSFSAATVHSTGNREAIPYTIVTWTEAKSKNEAGIPKSLRNVRIAAVFMSFVALIGTFLTLTCKPRPKPRTAINFIWVILFIAGCVLATIGFAWGIHVLPRYHRCPPQYQITFEQCENKIWKGTVQLIFDASLAVGCLFSAIFLAWYSITGDWRLQRMGWRERERDAETEAATQKDPRHLSMHYIRPVRMTFLFLILFWTFAATICDAIFIIYIHEDRDKVYPEAGTVYLVDGVHQPRGQDLDHRLGWASRNTRLRYALSIIAMATVLLNLIPFTHRLLAYIFAFFYFTSCVMCFVSFGLDVSQLRKADKWYGKPICTKANNLKCVKSPYIATCIMEFFLGLALLFYIIYEICAKCCTHSRHSQRSYAPHELKKHDLALDSLRPVRCEITGRVLTAKEYVYRWRFIAGTAAAADYVPMYPEQPLYAAEGYVPDAALAAAAGVPFDVYGAPPVVL